MHSAVEFGALVHPAFEHRADGPPELVLGVLGKVLTVFAQDSGLVVLHDRLPVLRCQGGVDADVQGIFAIVEDLLEQMVIDPQNDVGIHLNKTTVAIERETPVVGQARQPLDRGVVEAEV